MCPSNRGLHSRMSYLSPVVDGYTIEKQGTRSSKLKKTAVASSGLNISHEWTVIKSRVRALRDRALLLPPGQPPLSSASPMPCCAEHIRRRRGLDRSERRHRCLDIAGPAQCGCLQSLASHNRCHRRQGRGCAQAPWPSPRTSTGPIIFRIQNLDKHEHRQTVAEA